MAFVALAMVVMIVAGIVGGAVVLPVLLQARRQMGDNVGSTHLVAELERLRLEVGDLQGDIVNLTERLDFTEKLLSSGPRAEQNPESDQPT